MIGESANSNCVSGGKSNESSPDARNAESSIEGKTRATSGDNDLSLERTVLMNDIHSHQIGA